MRDRSDRERRPCPDCGRDVVVTRSGRLMAHKIPAGDSCVGPAWRGKNAHATSNVSPAVLGAAGDAQNPRTTGMATAQGAPHLCGVDPGSPGTPTSPADRHRGTVRRRALTLDDIVTSALMAETPAELHETTRALLMSDIPAWFTTDLRDRLPDWALRIVPGPGRINASRLLRALTVELEKSESPRPSEGRGDS